MYTFNNILPKFLKGGNSGQRTDGLRAPVVGHGCASPAMLRRKTDALEASLANAESRLSALRIKVHESISAYESHYRFLRQVACSAVNASSPTKNNGIVLRNRREDLAEDFEDVQLALQVARLKARAQKEELEKLVAETEREREPKRKNRVDEERDSRARAQERWQVVERETGMRANVREVPVAR